MGHSTTAPPPTEKETNIPIISLNHDNKTELVQTLRDACIHVGFFYLEGHGISQELMNHALEQSKLLFDLPLDEKKALSDPVTNRGYTAMEEETLDPQRQSRGDTKEGFYIGQDIEPGNPLYDPAKLAVPNQWPDSQQSPSMKNCQEFKRTMTEYRRACDKVCFELVQLLALAIGLNDEHYFDAMFENPILLVRLAHYAKQQSQPEKGIFACGAHSDYGMLTLLLTDQNSGLQIYTAPDNAGEKEDEWLDVPPRPGAFVVNLGDMLERWTNGLFRSTLHRVLTTGETERYSIPCFYKPNFDTVVKVLDVCCSEDNPPKYPPTTAGQHLLDKYKQTHADFQG